MAIKYAIEQHATAYPSKCLASDGGKHIFNIHATEDVDNGFFVGKGDWESFDLYAEAAPTSATGIVVDVAANGNYYVEIKSADNALMVYTLPLVEEGNTEKFKAASNFYNASGDVLRAYELAVGDIVELSAMAFSGAVAKGDAVSLQAITGKTAMQFGK